VLSRGHFCIFLPKFHPELNFIERHWPRVKWNARQNGDGAIKGLKAQADVAMAMSSETCDLALMRRYSRTVWRWEVLTSSSSLGFNLVNYVGFSGVLFTVGSYFQFPST
jgi:hypothetical protein